MTQNGLNRWIQEWYEQNETDLRAYMHDVWSHPEVGLNNEHAARVSWQFAKTHGFPDAKLVRAGEGLKETEHPNAVVAEYGTGSPKVAIVGELDALPGLGNENVPYRAEIKGPGHGCGHNLIAGSCMGAACALRYAMEKEGVKGTLRMVEAPGEEVGRGKAKLAEDGVFSDLDHAKFFKCGQCQTHGINRPPQFPGQRFLCIRDILSYINQAAVIYYPGKGKQLYPYHQDAVPFRQQLYLLYFPVIKNAGG